MQGEHAACAIALDSSEMSFAAGLGTGLRTDRAAAARRVVSSFKGPAAQGYAYRYALVMADALAGYTDDFIEQLTLQTAGRYQLFGGGAGDDARFERTHVFHGTEAHTDAAVALEILSNKPLGLGVSHGWEPGSPPMRVTEVDGMRLVSLNAVAASDAFEAHAERTGQTFDRSDPMPFFLHNILGIATDAGFKLRVPLGLGPDGSVLCASDLPLGANVHIMKASGNSAADAAVLATTAAVGQLGGRKPQVALFFDCVATRLRLQKDFGTELRSLQNELGEAQFAGCNTYGQIARIEGQFSGFHNCTAVVCVFPE
jgi:hypothetical protein